MLISNILEFCWCQSTARQNRHVKPKYKGSNYSYNKTVFKKNSWIRSLIQFYQTRDWQTPIIAILSPKWVIHTTAYNSSTFTACVCLWKSANVISCLPFHQLNSCFAVYVCYSLDHIYHLIPGQDKNWQLLEQRHRNHLWSRLSCWVDLHQLIGHTTPMPDTIDTITNT